MNKFQEMQLRSVAASLSRSGRNNAPPDLSATHAAIKETILEIYKSEADILTVFRVEQILNDGYANVSGNALRADKQMENLTERASIALEVYKIFHKDPRTYVEYVDIANKGIGKFPGEGRRFADGVPIEPVRAALMQLRKQLAAELTQVDPQTDRKETNKARFDETIRAERFYLEKYLANRKNEQERQKQLHLQSFDRRMEKQLRELEPKQAFRQESPH